MQEKIIDFLKQIVAESDLAGQKRLIVFDPAQPNGEFFSTVPLKNFSKVTPVRIKDTDFQGGSYTDSRLVNKVAETDFDVVAVEGDGGFLNVGTAADGYSFDSVLGKITCNPGKYLILIY